jgi:SAM-dependent methyltransferase/glycosyltransferase involved in cell wall biosynthesis
MANTGERLTVGHLLETELEHFHRYYFARHFARGRIVLDVASGEGYGSATLAQVAAEVTGVDVSADAIAHARVCYTAPNIRFVHGDACHLPVPDESVDLVTSFETIEHFYDHAKFLAEIRRVLRPGGLLIVSTPDRDIYSPPNAGANPHHVHELSKDAFHRLCAGQFRHVALLTQSTIVGSVLATDQPDPPNGPRLVFERRGESHVESSTGGMRGKFCLCVASDAPLPPLGDSLLIHDTAIGPHAPGTNELTSRIHGLRESLDRREGDIARLNGLLARREEFVRDGVGRFIGFHQTALERAERERARLLEDLAQRDAALTQCRVTIARRDEAIMRLDETVARLSRDRIGRLFARGARAIARRVRSLRGVASEATAAGPAQPAVGIDSKLFDPAWYLDRYPDVREAGLDPAQHFLVHGFAEGRDPGPDFSTASYLADNPDVRLAGINPLLHYEQFGRAERRRIVPVGTHPGADARGELAEAAARLGVLARHGGAPRLVYISGEPDTPGHLYRVARLARAASRGGARVTILRLDAIRPATPPVIGACDLLVIWRAPWDSALGAAVQAARAGGARVLYDVDDLMFEPEIARPEIIDGIRSQGYDAGSTAALFGRIAEAVAACDAGSAPTRYLAGRLQRRDKPAFVLPNGFDDETWAVARRAVRLRRTQPRDGKLRIGYAAGSRTHQKDFAVCATAVAGVLRARPEARLVVFRQLAKTCLDIEEFPELHGLEDQIEWRDMVALAELPGEIARFDISIAPLEAGNPFCEAKSELKYFESALVEVPVIASPTAVFQSAIDPGRTGLLAGDAAGWEAALARLVDDPTERARMGRAAYQDVLWRYGPHGAVEAMRSLLAQIAGGCAEAARAFELDTRRAAAPAPRAVAIGPHEAEILQDRMGDAAASIVIPLHNYAHYVTEALESAGAQTIPLLDLIVVDDASTDGGAEIARAWMLANRHLFGRLVLVRNAANAGLGPTRNIGFSHAETAYVIPLDADNRLRPRFAELCLAEAEESGAAFTYPMIQSFGDSERLMGRDRYMPQRLASGNYIDAMALVRLAAWSLVGGYGNVRYGWEDYDLWCRFAEHGLFGREVPEILADYRVHAQSMLQTVTEVGDHRRQLIANMRERHAWVLDGVAAD